MPRSGGPDWDWSLLGQRCLREASRHTARLEDAEDAAQEALLRAWRAGSRRQGVERPEAWIRAIARNEVRRGYQRSAPREVVGGERAVAEVPDGLDEVDRRLDVARAISTLTDQERTLIALRYEGDLTQGAIARVLGIPEGTVKVRLHRVRRRLRRELEGADHVGDGRGSA